MVRPPMRLTTRPAGLHPPQPHAPPTPSYSYSRNRYADVVTVGNPATKARWRNSGYRKRDKARQGRRSEVRGQGLPVSRGSGVSSMGLPCERNWDELWDRFCLAFLTDFRENPSTLSTDGDVVAAEDIALWGDRGHRSNIS